MTISLSLNILFPIYNWMKNSPTGMSVPLPAPEIDQLHLLISVCSLIYDVTLH